MPENQAAWLPAKNAKLQVGPAPYTPPRDHEIVVRNRAVAINPVDWIIPQLGSLIFPWLKPPTVLGSDVAGEVVEVGAGVTRFRAGDRVLGHALGMSKARNTPAEGAFQLYTVLVDRMTTPIPDGLSFEAASVLPLGVSTAACGLFQTDFLALRPPSTSPSPTGETVLVWGGSTSVGSNAIQLAVAAGYEVITTASPRNFDYVERLGASQAFDYNAKTVVRDVIKAFKGKRLAGALAIGVGSADPCVEIVAACEGERFVSTASPPVSFDSLPPGGGVSLTLIGLIGRMLGANLAMAAKVRLRGVRTKSIFGDSLADNPIGPAIYVDFLPKALAAGTYKAAPDPMVVGQGLDAVQNGFDVQRAGVSAKKVVVTL